MTGILDEYPGAVAAYSLRLLNTDYTGDAVIVRRASDNATQNIGFVDGDLDTGALNTFCTGTDGFVTTWFDQSGNANNATNTTASGQPKIYDSVNGIELENNKATVQFAGGGVGLQANFSGVFYSQPNDIFVVNKKEQTSGHLFDGITFAFRNAQPNDTLFAGVTLNNAYPDTEINKQNLFNALFNEANSESYINSQLQVTGDTGTDLLSGISIGTRVNFTNGLVGNIQEFVIYSSNQSANRNGIEDNINNYYSIY